VLLSETIPDGFFAHNKAEYIILTALPLQHCVRNLPSMLGYIYIGCLVGKDLCIYGLHLMVLLILNKESKFYDSRDFTGIVESQFYLIQFS